MNPKNGQPAGELGLAANGSSRKWYVAVDEAIDGDEWSLEIDGPHVYLVFQLRDPKVVSEAARFLQSRPRPNLPGGRRGAVEELVLGRFGSASVSLVWDDEGFSRCFLIVGPKAKSTLRLGFDAEDVQMLHDALVQATEDLAQTGGG